MPPRTLRRLGQLVRISIKRVIDGIPPQRLFRAEMAPEQPVADTDLIGSLAQAHRLIAILGKRLQRARQHRLARRIRR